MKNSKGVTSEVEGIVTHRAGDRIIVETQQGSYSCTTAKKNRFHKTTYGGVLVGDQVSIRTSQEQSENELLFDNAGIETISPRRNAFFRGNPELLSEPQGIASNIDNIVIIGAVEERTTPFGLIDRILIAAECCEDVERLVLWNKIDLLPPNVNFKQTEFYTIYNRIGYQVEGISVKQTTSKEINTLFPEGRSLLIGASGVGKSTLLNRCIPGLELATNPISSSSGKGTHTTSVAHLYRLSETKEIIDTPGFKSFILNGVTSQIELHFPEFREYIQSCQFADCSHVKDKGCAIRGAVETGKISQSRYDSYLSLFRETVSNR